MAKHWDGFLSHCILGEGIYHWFVHGNSALYNKECDIWLGTNRINVLNESWSRSWIFVAVWMGKYLTIALVSPIHWVYDAITLQPSLKMNFGIVVFDFELWKVEQGSICQVIVDDLV